MDQLATVLIALSLSGCSPTEAVSSRDQLLSPNISNVTPQDGGIAPTDYTPSATEIVRSSQMRIPDPLKTLTDGVSGVGVVLCNSAASRFTGAAQDPETIVTDYSVQVTELIDGVLPPIITTAGGTIGADSLTGAHLMTMRSGNSYLVAFRPVPGSTPMPAVVRRVENDQITYLGQEITLQEIRKKVDDDRHEHGEHEHGAHDEHGEKQ